jgi:hypothetical protein
MAGSLLILSGIDVKNLYVALTRASSTLTVLSAGSMLQPSA